MNAVTKLALALGLLAGAAWFVPEAAFARGGGGGGGKSAGSGGGKSGAPKSGGTGKGGKPGSNSGNKSNANNAKGRGDFLQDMQRDEAADCRGAFLDDATLEVIRTRRIAERGE
jgi:hypothetical protein